jgi:hypothetical protein
MRIGNFHGRRIKWRLTRSSVIGNAVHCATVGGDILTVFAGKSPDPWFATSGAVGSGKSGANSQNKV